MEGAEIAPVFGFHPQQRRNYFFRHREALLALPFDEGSEKRFRLMAEESLAAQRRIEDLSRQQQERLQAAVNRVDEAMCKIRDAGKIKARDRIAVLDTNIDAPAPQGRYRFSFDSRAYADGDYELFVQATTPSGLKSHPSYGDETYHFDAAQLSGAYYPMPITIDN